MLGHETGGRVQVARAPTFVAAKNVLYQDRASPIFYGCVLAALAGVSMLTAHRPGGAFVVRHKAMAAANWATCRLFL